MTMGKICYRGYRERNWRLAGCVDYVALASMKQIVDEFTKDLAELTDSVLRNVSTAFEELMYFNSPDRFILEETPLAVLEKKEARAGKAKMPRFSG